MKKMITLVLVLGVLLQTHAQDTTGAVKQFMEKARDAYAKAAYLSCKVLYRYANKGQPGKYIDTIPGEMFLDKNRMRWVIDNVETVTTDKYTIRVMKEEKLIYLAKAMPAPEADPVSLLDTLLAHIGGVRTQIMHKTGQTTLLLVFPPGQTYKTVSMTINDATGWFQQVVYELYTENFISPDQIEQPGNAAPYQKEGIIEVLFSQYKQGGFTEALFNENRYITRLGPGRFEPAEPYKDYQVFLATPGL